MTGLLFTLIWFPLVGLAVSRIAGRMNLFLAGAGMNGLALFVAGALTVPVPLMLLVVGFASLAILVIVRGEPRPKQPRESIAADMVLAAAIVILLAVSAISPLADFDGRAFWLLKAKAIASEARIDGPHFHGMSYNPRNEYPLLVPLDAASVMLAAGELDDRHVRWLYAFFAIALAFEVRRRAGAWWGALLLWLPQIGFSDAGGALSAYSDIALAAFLACAVFELASDAPDPWRTGLWLSFALLTKNEGFPFAVVLLAMSAFVFRLRAFRAAIPVVVACAALWQWRRGIAPTDEAEFAVAELPHRLDRIGDALATFVKHALAFADWGIFWIAVAAAAGFLVWQRRWRPLSIAGGAILPMLAIYQVMYIVSNWKTEDLVNSSAPRLLTHFIGPAMLLLGHADRKDD